MKIQQDLIIHSPVTYKGINRRKYITIHETANTNQGANAKAHALLQKQGFSSSWHWQVDEEVAIQSFSHTVQCWHAGDGRGPGNTSSIAIEICVNADGNYIKAVKNAALLTKRIMKQENIPVTHVVQHHHWSGKNCPTILRSNNKQVNWQLFQQMLHEKDDEIVQSYTLYIGSRGNTVKKLQQDLTTIGFKLNIDGIYGVETTFVVQFFQATYLLLVDGIFGPQTASCLEEIIQGNPAKKYRILRKGMHGEAVRVVQYSLKKIGYSIVVDGIYGSYTTNCIRTLQSNYQLDIDGTIGRQTWKLLKRLVFV